MIPSPTSSLTWTLLVSLSVTVVTAGVTSTRNRIRREVYPEIIPENDDNQGQQVCIVGDVVYGIDEPVPAEQPCLKCRCKPPGVQCETIVCLKKPRCKAIHRPNSCCPDYQCECEYEGKTYANGEKLATSPGGECQVCYCRGGEVQCAQVSCYIRSDCKGKTVPGQCCPKYDNCPPIEPLLDRPTMSSPDVNKEVLELWPLSTLLQNISDDNSSINQDINKIVDADVKLEDSKITIQEIIPEIQEIPITPSTKSEEDTFTNKFDHTNDLIVTDAEPDSSELSEVFQQPPPILRIGDKLLFLKKGELVPEKDTSTPSSVITIIGAEGLQRGYEDSGEIHEHDIRNDEYSLFNNSNDLEPKASESTHILSLVKRKHTTTTTTTSPSTSTEIQIDSTTIPSLELNSTISDNITETSTDIVIEENPAYPPIPDIMKPENPEKIDEVEKNLTDTKILQEVLEMRSNKTVPQNITNNEWLKVNNETLLNPRAALPEDILKQVAPSDGTTEYNETISETTTVTSERSIESMEVTTEYSQELTTPQQVDSHDSIVSKENISAEDIDEIILAPSDLEISDMLIDSIISTSPSSTIDDVEIINNQTHTMNNDKIATTPISPVDKDVEIIMKNLTELQPKIVEKRENSQKDQNDEIFRQLNEELEADSNQKDFDDNEEESQKIFKELLEETSTPKTRKKPRNKDEETVQRVSDAIARATLGSQKNPFSGDLLSLISNFFSGQYRQKK